METIISYLSQLLALGLPPNIAEEAAFRDWLKGVRDVLAKAATQTTNMWDNYLVSLLGAVFDDEEAWQAFYAIINARLTGLFGDDLSLRLSGRFNLLQEKVGFDLAVIKELIELIIRLIELWRK